MFVKFQIYLGEVKLGEFYIPMPKTPPSKAPNENTFPELVKTKECLLPAATSFKLWYDK